MTYNNDKIFSLMKRVNNSELVITEEQNDSIDIKEYCAKVFGDGGQNPDRTLLDQFNNLVVKLGDEVAAPRVTSLFEIFANKQTANRGDLVQLEIPQEFKAKVQWSANGTGVDLTRVDGKSSTIGIPSTFSTGFYYEPLDLVRDSEVTFKKLVNIVAEAKVDLFMKEINALFNAAVTSGLIPSKNVLSGANLAIADYNKLASVLSRFGGKPIFVADSLLIDHFAMQQATDAGYSALLTDRIREELLTSLNPTTIGRTTAVNLVNPFLDNGNSKTELPVNIGYMFAGGVKQKPFSVVEYGGLRQLTEQDIEDERIQVKIYQDASVTMVYGNALGFVKETSAVTL